MAFISDLVSGGYWPMQHHDPTPEAALRLVRFGLRVEDRDEETGAYITASATAGDVIGGLLWPATSAPTPDPAQATFAAKPPMRDFPAWGYAWPAITTEASRDLKSGSKPSKKPRTQGQPQQIRAGTVPRTRPQGSSTPRPDQGNAGSQAGDPAESRVRVRPIGDEAVKADGRFSELDAVPTSATGKGETGIVLAATHEHRQVELFIPTDDRLIAVHHAGDPAAASIVHDLDAESAPDPDRKARLHSMMRVVRPVDGCVPFRPVEDSNSLAWQLGTAGQDELPGRGLVADGEGISPGPLGPAPGSGDFPPAGQATLARQTSGVASEQAPSANRVQGTEERGGGAGTVAPAQVLGAASARVGGPLEVGDAGDQHQIAATMDGEAINSLHLSTDALFRGAGGDAPLDFQPLPYSEPEEKPHKTRVHLRLNKARKHNWPCGDRQGLWQWEAETPIYIPGEDIDDPTGGGNGGGLDDPSGGGSGGGWGKGWGGWGHGKWWWPGGPICHQPRPHGGGHGGDDVGLPGGANDDPASGPPTGTTRPQTGPGSHQNPFGGFTFGDPLALDPETGLPITTAHRGDITRRRRPWVLDGVDLDTDPKIIEAANDAAILAGQEREFGWLQVNHPGAISEQQWAFRHRWGIEVYAEALRRAKRRAVPGRSTQSLEQTIPAAPFKSRDGIDPHEPTAAALVPFASPALLGRPQKPDIGARDLRRDLVPEVRETYAHDHEAPITARIEAFGKHAAGEWEYLGGKEVAPEGGGDGAGGLGNSKPSLGRYVGGAGGGGFVVMSPRIDVADAVVAEENLTYFGIHPDVSLAWGKPDQSRGEIVDGWRVSLDSTNGRLTYLAVDDAGAVDVDREILMEGYLRVGPSDLSRAPTLKFGISGGANISSNIGASRLEINQGLSIGTMVPGSTFDWDPFSAIGTANGHLAVTGKILSDASVLRPNAARPAIVTTMGSGLWMTNAATPVLHFYNGTTDVVVA